MSECLIFFEFDIFTGKGKIKEILNQIKFKVEILKISSVYKRETVLSESIKKKYSEKNKFKKNQTQEFCVRIKTDFSVNELMDYLDLTKANNDFDFKVLICSNEIKLTPKVTLPHPNIHLDGVIAHAAAEVWPDFVHPILGSTLRQISLNHKEDSLEFMFFGKLFLEMN